MILKAIVLAAGASRRFGGCKLVAPLAGRPLMAGALDAALAAPVEAVVLVTGQHGGAVRACARSLQPRALAEGRLCLLDAPGAADGMGASLAAGVEAVGAADGVFVFLADMPWTPRDLPGRLAARLTDGVAAVAPVWNGRRGHPVLFARALIPRLRQARADQGARATLEGLGDALVLVEAPGPAVLLDVDTADDLDRLAAGPRIGEG